MDSKNALRVRIQEKRKELSGEWVEEISVIVQDRLTSLPEFKNAQTVCCYLGFGKEVGTGRILDAAWRMAKQVCVPAYDRNRGQYRLALLGMDTVRSKGLLGIEEPADPTWVELADVDFMVIPGLAFDSRGGRLGHGRGHYDRLLGVEHKGKLLFKAGLAFEFQVMERVPMTEQDVKMDAVITEKRAIRCGPASL